MADKAQFPDNLVVQAVTFTTATSGLAAAVDLYGVRPVALQMPAAWTTGNITAQVSKDGTTYANLYDRSGTEYTITVTASRYVILDPADFVSVRYIKLRSGTNGTPVAQATGRTVHLICDTL